MGRGEAVITAKGGLDWEWFHRERRQKQEWRKAGLCVDCGLRPPAGGMVVCEECRGIPSVRTERCSFCGTKRGVFSGKGQSGPTFPCEVRWCRKCDDKKIPEPEATDEDGAMTPVMNTPVPTQLRAGIIYLKGYGELWDEMPDGDIPMAHARRHPAYCPNCKVAQYCNHAERRAAFVNQHQKMGCTPKDPLINLVEAAGAFSAPDRATDDDIESWTGLLVEALARWKSHGLERTRAALAAGAALVEVQRIIGHGHFSGYLATHGVAYRTARNWMDLHQVGLSAEEVQERGGIKKTLASLRHVSSMSAQGLTPLPGMGVDSPSPLPDGEDGGKSATVSHLPPAEDGKLLIDWTDDDWEEYRNCASEDAPAASPQPHASLAASRCASCQTNTPRRGFPYCRPCQLRVHGPMGTPMARLIKENARLRKAVKGLKWQLYGSAGVRK